MKLEALSQKVVQELIKRNLILSTAESCTGGWIAKQITDISGSSQVFIGGVVSYSNQMKEKWLGVKSGTLQKFGAVSAETIHEMLVGIQQATDSDWAIAVSGVAGPSGGSPEKPVGTVFIGWRFRGQEVVTRFQFSGSREEIRKKSVETALQFLVDSDFGL